MPKKKKNLNTHTNLAKKKNKIKRDDKLVRKKKKKHQHLNKGLNIRIYKIFYCIN